jgi:hypothetical protein
MWTNTDVHSLSKSRLIADWSVNNTRCCQMLVCCRKGKRSNKHVFLIRLFKVILHQFWVKQIFLWKFNLENGGIFTKLFMHVSSRNMFPTTRNLQIHMHVYRPRHCCGDWLTFGCFVPMIADHDLVKKSHMYTIVDAS